MNQLKLPPLHIPFSILLSPVLFVLAIFLISCTPTEGEVVVEPFVEEITEPDEKNNFYDGWDTGVSFAFSDEVPLRFIDVDNDGMFHILSSAEFDPSNNPMGGQGTTIIVYSDYPFVFPSITPLSAVDFVERLIAEGDFMGNIAKEVLVQPQEVQLGENNFAYAIATTEQGGLTVTVYSAFGRIGERMVIVTAFAPLGEEVALQSAVEPVLASMQPVNHDGWEMYVPERNFSAAHPAGWTISRTSGEYGHIFYTNPDNPQNSESAIHLSSPSNSLGGDSATMVESLLAEEGTTTLLEPSVVPYLDDMVVGAGEMDGQTFLVGVFQLPNSMPRLVTTWNVDDWETNRPLFEKVLRGIRPRVVPMLFDPEISAEIIVDSRLVGQRWHWIAGNHPDDVPIVLQNSPQLLFDSLNSEQGRFVFTASTGCADVVGDFKNVAEYSLEFVEPSFSPTDCSEADREQSQFLADGLSGQAVYALEGDFLLVNTINDKLHVFSKQPPESAFPYTSDDPAALASLLMEIYRSQGPSEDIVEIADSDLFLDATGWRMERFGNSLDIWVFDGDQAALAAIDKLSPESINGRVWQKSRYVAVWAGQESPDLDPLLAEVFGESKVVGSDVDEKLQDGRLLNNFWYFITGQTVEGEQIFDNPLERDIWGYLMFENITRNDQWMGYADLKCAGFSWTYLINTVANDPNSPSQMVFDGITVDSELYEYCSPDDNPLPLVNDSAEYDIQDNYLLVRFSDGTRLIFAGEPSAIKPEEATITTALELFDSEEHFNWSK